MTLSLSYTHTHTHTHRNSKSTVSVCIFDLSVPVCSLQCTVTFLCVSACVCVYLCMSGCIKPRPPSVRSLYEMIIWPHCKCPNQRNNDRWLQITAADYPTGDWHRVAEMEGEEEGKERNMDVTYTDNRRHVKKYRKEMGQFGQDVSKQQYFALPLP